MGQEIRRNYAAGQVTNASQQFAIYGQYLRVMKERSDAVAKAKSEGNPIPPTPLLSVPTEADGKAGQAALQGLRGEALRRALADSRNLPVNIDNQRKREREAAAASESAKRSAWWDNPQNRLQSVARDAKPTAPADNRVAAEVPFAAQAHKLILNKGAGTAGTVGTNVGIYGETPRSASDELNRSRSFMTASGDGVIVGADPHHGNPVIPRPSPRPMVKN